VAYDPARNVDAAVSILARVIVERHPYKPIPLPGLLLSKRYYESSSDSISSPFDGDLPEQERTIRRLLDDGQEAQAGKNLEGFPLDVAAVVSGSCCSSFGGHRAFFTVLQLGPVGKLPYLIAVRSLMHCIPCTCSSRIGRPRWLPWWSISASPPRAHRSASLAREGYNWMYTMRYKKIISLHLV